MGLTQARQIIVLVLLSLILGFVIWDRVEKADLEEKAAVGEQRGEVLTNASAGIQEGVNIDEFQAGYAAALQQGRDNFKSDKQKAIQNEPATAARASTRVPDSVRNAYRERRLARERLGCAGSECQKDD